MPGLRMQPIEQAARRVHESNDPKALVQLQVTFFPFLCGIVRETERELRRGIEVQEDELDPTKTVYVPIPPWRHHPSIRGPRDALRILLTEFAWLVVKRWDPNRGPFQPFLFKYGKHLLKRKLHYEIARTAPFWYEFDQKKGRAFPRHKIFLVTVPEDEVESVAEDEAGLSTETDVVCPEADPVRRLALASSYFPEYVNWSALVSDAELQVIIKCLEAHGDDELAAQLLQQAGRQVKPETIRRVKRRLIKRARSLCETLKTQRKIEGEGVYGVPASEKVKLGRFLRRSLDKDGDFADL